MTHWTCDQCLVSTNPVSVLKCLSCEAIRPDLSPEEIAKIVEDQARAKADAISKFRSPASEPSGFFFGAPAETPQTPVTFGFAAPFLPSIPQSPANTIAFGFTPVEPVQNRKQCDKPETGKLPMGDLFVHGSGECEQLGLGEGLLERKKPTHVKSISNVVAVSCGSLHNIALCQGGKVVSWGCNDDGALGRSGTENVPESVAFPEGVDVKAISAGDCHSAFIDTSDTLWLCGTYKDSSGHLGFPSGEAAKSVPKQKEPVKITGLLPTSKRLVVSELSCGANHTAVLIRPVGAKKDTLVLWGNDEFGQLGQGNRGDTAGLDERWALELKHSARSKRKIQSKLHPHPIAWNEKTHGGAISHVFCTANATFVVTDKDDVYACGLNNFCQLGLGQPSAEPVREFTRVNALCGLGVVSICGGSFHTVALTKGGEVWAWGRGDYCGLGNTTGDIPAPKRIHGLTSISSLAAGGSHSLACDSNGDFFTWGFGETHQLANCPRDISQGAAKASDDAKDELRPYLVQSKQLSEKFVFAVAAGAQHSVELGWTGHYDEEIQAKAKKRAREE